VCLKQFLETYFDSKLGGNMSKSIYERILDLRNRISLDGDDTIYEEDYLLLDEVLDLIESSGNWWRKNNDEYI